MTPTIVDSSRWFEYWRYVLINGIDTKVDSRSSHETIAHDESDKTYSHQSMNHPESRTLNNDDITPGYSPSLLQGPLQAVPS